MVLVEGFEGVQARRLISARPKPLERPDYTHMDIQLGAGPLLPHGLGINTSVNSGRAASTAVQVPHGTAVALPIKQRSMMAQYRR